MPHMANLPWLYFYFLIALILTLFWAKENFSFPTGFKSFTKSKINTKTLYWNW